MACHSCWHTEDAFEGPGLGAVRGSGTQTITVTGHIEIDNMRSCEIHDYQGEMPGRWVSLGHIKDHHRSRIPHQPTQSIMPEYVWLPYQCKRQPLDYLEVQSSGIQHVAYVGDSIFRTSYCGQLFPALHNGTTDGPCQWFDSFEYDWSDKDFAIDGKTYSMRFVQRDAWEMVPRFQTLGNDVSHVMVNVGMWYGGARTLDDYIHGAVGALQRLYEQFGDEPYYTWVDTYSLSPGVFCYDDMRRSLMVGHGAKAAAALDHFRNMHPTVKINRIHSFPIVDSRPETTSDGR